MNKSGKLTNPSIDLFIIMPNFTLPSATHLVKLLKKAQNSLL
jgi:hypothetical protein